MTGLGVNHHRAAWHAYCRDRAQRRQDHVADLARRAAGRAQTPARRVEAGERARQDAESAFDAAEPELSYDEFVAGVTA